MAGFHTHISVSTAVGAGYAWWVHAQYGLPWTTAAVAGGLCSVAGMLPDLDSDSGVPARETITFTAAVVPMLLINRLQHLGMTYEQMILVGAPLYLFIRFGLGTLLKEFTVHRGMFHSIPAMILAGLLTFLISDSSTILIRSLKGIAVSLGFLSHLILDEIWSVEVTLTGSRLKKSSGTALKFFGSSPAANAMCWGLLLLVGFGVYEDAGLTVTGDAMPQVAPAPLQPPGELSPVPDAPFVEPPPALPPRAPLTPNRTMYQARTHRFDTDEQ